MLASASIARSDNTVTVTTADVPGTLSMRLSVAITLTPDPIDRMPPPPLPTAASKTSQTVEQTPDPLPEFSVFSPLARQQLSPLKSAALPRPLPSSNQGFASIPISTPLMPLVPSLPPLLRKSSASSVRQTYLPFEAVRFQTAQQITSRQAGRRYNHPRRRSKESRGHKPRHQLSKSPVRNNTSAHLSDSNPPRRSVSSVTTLNIKSTSTFNHSGTRPSQKATAQLVSVGSVLDVKRDPASSAVVNSADNPAAHISSARIVVPPPPAYVRAYAVEGTDLEYEELNILNQKSCYVCRQDFDSIEAKEWSWRSRSKPIMETWVECTANRWVTGCQRRAHETCHDWRCEKLGLPLQQQLFQKRHVECAFCRIW